MPASRKLQKKDRFVIDFILARSCAYLLSHSAASPKEKCGQTFFIVSSHTCNENFDAFTAENVLLQLDPLLPMAARLPRLMPFPPNVSKLLRPSVLKSMLCLLTLSRVLNICRRLFVNILIVLSVMKLPTP
jgi:hypothetical protein